MLEERYSDGHYLEHNPGWHAADSPFKAAWIHDILRRNAIEPLTFAEIGCGAGEILLQLHKKYPNAHLSGYDISPQAFEICSAKQTKNVNFYFQDLLTADAGKFDVLLAIDVFEHVPDYMGFITALKSRAEYKVFHIPLDLSVQGLMRPSALAYSRNAIGHLHYFTKETALATLRDCDLEIVDWRYTHGTEDLPNQKLRTRVLNLPRKVLRMVSADLSARYLGGSSIMVLAR